MSRISCLDCVRKHLSQASILMDESALGYPHHKWFAVGHLAEAESECRREHLEFAKEIRKCRLAIMNGNEEPCFDTLLITACSVAGENVVLDKNNSKTIEKEEKKLKV